MGKNSGNGNGVCRYVRAVSVAVTIIQAESKVLRLLGFFLFNFLREVVVLETLTYLLAILLTSVNLLQAVWASA